MVTAGAVDVPVLRPRLPSADQLLPYLRRIDAARVYSNWGPLVGELECRLTSELRLPFGGVASAASGTAALIGAILGTAGRARPDRPFALLPAYTFVATAAAVEQCGYRPYLVDVGEESWMLEPAGLREHPMLSHTGLVVAVAPFGRPVPQAGWSEFRDASGIPVVIDGAAALDRVRDAPDRFLGRVPVGFSFHATKAFAAGEGGCIAGTDCDLVLRSSQALNFGFHMSRDSTVASTNGKMSEYHAAVGLAELDGWAAKLMAIERVAAAYRAGLGDLGLSGRLAATPEIGASYALFRCGDGGEAARVREHLAGAHVDSRFWYGGGLHCHPYLADAPRDDLTVTESLAGRLLGIPLAPDLSDDAISRVVTALAQGVEQP